MSRKNTTRRTAAKRAYQKDVRKGRRPDPTPWWPVSSLLRSLSHAHWGPLGVREHRGTVAILSALARLLPDESGEGLATIHQVQMEAGYGRTWTRSRLLALEDLGLITWTRGGVEDGRPTPGAFRINKKTLLALIQVARELKDEAEAAHRAATLARIRAWSLRWTKNAVGRFRRSYQVSPCDHLLPLSGEESVGLSAPPGASAAAQRGDAPSSTTIQADAEISPSVWAPEAITEALEVLALPAHLQRLRLSALNPGLVVLLRRGLPVHTTTGQIITAQDLQVVA